MYAGTKTQMDALQLAGPLPDSFPAMFHITDTDGIIRQVSDLWLETLGYARDDVIGRRNFDFLTPDALAAAQAVFDKYQRDRRLDKLECEFLTRAGTPVPCTLSARVLADDTGAVTGNIAILAPLQAGADMEKRLETKAFRLQSCLEGTHAASWEWNAQTDETLFSARWAEIVGYTLDELRPMSGKIWENLAHPDDRKSSEDALRAHLKGETPSYDIEARMRHKDGRWIWVRSRGRVFTWTDDGRAEWMFGTHFSIDSRKRREAQSNRRRKLLERMGQLAGVGGWEVDLATSEVIWTGETRRIHGVGDDYMPNLAEAISFYAPEARHKVEEAVDLAMTQGIPWDLELPFLRMNGERIWVRAVGEIEFEDGKPRRLFGAFQDITERVRKDCELRATQEWMELAAKSGGVGLWSFDAVDGSVTWDDMMLEHFMVCSESKPRTLSDWLAIIPDGEVDKVKSEIRKMISGQGQMDVEIEHRDSENMLHALKLTGEPSFDSQGMIDRIHGACFDLTPERRLMFELQEQTSKMSVTLSSIGDGVITTDRDRRVTWMNNVAITLSGWPLEDAVGRPSDEVFAVFDETTGKPATDPVRRCLTEGRAVDLQPNAVLRTKTGGTVAVDDSAAPIIDHSGRAIGAVVVFRDVTNQRRLSRDIEHRASHDLLTGLLNRAEFEKRLRDSLSDPMEKNGSYLIFLDLDHFKRVNDTLGHEAGDKLLHRVGLVLRQTAGADAHIARQGGDEFILITRQDSDEAAKGLAERICRAIAGIELQDAPRKEAFGIGASAGVVNLCLPATGVSQYMRRADIAAYSAKASGRGQVCMWSDANDQLQSKAAQLALFERIEQATAEGTWVVHEQRISPIGADPAPDDMHELLIRLPGEDGELIHPDRFLQAAERYGLMPAIDTWVVKYCLERIETGRPQGVLAVNLSASSVSSRSFQGDLLALMRRTPETVLRHLCVEITEHSILQDYDSACVFLGTLRDLGIKVAVDDFGSGASSFRYFKDLPADFLKIDGSFIRDHTDPVAAASIECFIKMARIAGFQTVAEHVEDWATIPILEAMGIDLVQGFAIGAPTAAA